MLAKLHTFSLLDIDAVPVEVEVDVSPGALPKTILVGLPEAAVKESTHRFRIGPSLAPFALCYAVLKCLKRAVGIGCGRLGLTQ